MTTGSATFETTANISSVIPADGRNGPDFRVPGETGLSDFWDQFDIAECRAIDGSTQYRRIEPGLPPVADGLPNRVGRIRGFGNAIVPQLAATFIRAFLEAEGE